MSNPQNEEMHFFNEISDAIIVTDIDYNINAWNRAAEDIYGWKAEEIIGKNIMDTIKIEYRNQNPKDVISEFETNGSWKGEVLQYSKKGDPLHIYSSVSLIHDSSGIPIKILAINEDLTETKAIKKKLRISERKYGLIVENALEGIWMIDDDDRTNFVNERLAQMLGYSREEMLGKHLLDFCDEKSAQIAKKNINRRKQGIKENHAFQFIKKNGEKIYTNLNASPIFTEEGRYIGSVAFITDITEKREAERKLKESEEKFRTMSEQSLIGLQIVQDGELKYINRKAAEFTGYTPKEIKKLGFNNALIHIHPEDIKKVQNRFKERIKNSFKLDDPFQFRVIRKTGDIKWVESLNRKIMYQSKEADLIFLVDITDKKKAQFELKNSEEKYKEAYNRANFYKDLFIHNMNNILQVLSSSTEILSHSFEDRKENDDFSHLMKMITKQIKRGIELVSKIHQISELEEKDLELVRIDAVEMLEKVIDYIKKAYNEKNIEITTKIHFKNYFVQANELLEEIFQNILINSIKYNEEEIIEIEIRASEVNDEQDDTFLRLEFIDNGIGIEDKRKQLIFMKGKQSAKRSKGMGLGLTLVNLLINKYAGKIWVEDRVEGNYQVGSNFSILLPKST
ncbi:MAG: PAS domain S-box protein [Candidatus Lokiarchaeota archaeon]|nr:PAS domain S-box protein [Candidatus Lokiarchaeota archaeon]